MYPFPVKLTPYGFDATGKNQSIKKSYNSSPKYVYLRDVLAIDSL